MLEKDIFTITTTEDFAELSLKVFQYQYQNTAVYRKFCDFLKLNPYSVKKITDIPFLPIQFFKSHSVISEGFSSEIIFSSSGVVIFELGRSQNDRAGGVHRLMPRNSNRFIRTGNGQ